jgi:hypothetical protein
MSCIFSRMGTSPQPCVNSLDVLYDIIHRKAPTFSDVRVALPSSRKLCKETRRSLDYVCTYGGLLSGSLISNSLVHLASKPSKLYNPSKA